MKAKLVFKADQNYKIWFLFSESCQTIPQKEQVENTLTSLQSSPLLRKQSFMTDTLSYKQKTRIQNYKSDTARVRSVQPIRKCGGDFCNLVISSPANKEEQDIDYDELLHKVKQTYCQDDFQAIKIRLSIATDYLLKSKLKRRKESHQIQYKWYLIGKDLLKKSNITKGKKQMEVDLVELVNIYQFGESQEDVLGATVVKVPYHYYRILNVCESCYQVYDIIRLAYTKFRSVKKMVRSSSVGKNVNNPMPSYMKTTIGYINKNNINDLLLDIQAAKKDINQRNKSVTDRFHRYYSQQTEEFKNRTQAEVLAQQIITKKSYLCARNHEPSTIQEEITSRFIPTWNAIDNATSSPVQRSKVSFRRFLNNRKKCVTSISRL